MWGLYEQAEGDIRKWVGAGGSITIQEWTYLHNAIIALGHNSMNALRPESSQQRRKKRKRQKTNKITPFALDFSNSLSK